MEKGNKAADNVSGTLLNTVEGQIGWIREVMIGRARRLAECGLTDITFMVIGQGIETMGAFLDKKPFRAKGQAASRFSVALDELFPPRYSALNGRGFLFANLRSSLTHLSVGRPPVVLAHTCVKAGTRKPYGRLCCRMGKNNRQTCRRDTADKTPGRCIICRLTRYSVVLRQANTGPCEIILM